MTSRGGAIAALTGVVAVALIVLSFIIGGDVPDIEDSGEQVLDFYRDEEGSQIASSVIGVFGAAFLLFFISAFSGRLRRGQEGEVLSRAAFAGGLLLALGGSLFAGLQFTLADTADNLDPSAAQAIHALNYDLFFPIALGSTVFFLATGIAAARGLGGLPRWLGWLAILIGLVSLTPIGFFGLLAGLAWIVVAGIVLALRPEEGRAGAPPPA